ncbi:MAG: L-rhamnose mutarotase [Terricaulis sp.]
MHSVTAFRMQLKPGCRAEYERRHDALWPELAAVLEAAGVFDYWIFFDPETLALFAFLRLRDTGQRETLANNPVVRRWWDHMAELMDTHADNRPVEWPLERVFHFPGAHAET